jgi:hypothetical protein
MKCWAVLMYRYFLTTCAVSILLLFHTLWHHHHSNSQSKPLLGGVFVAVTIVAMYSYSCSGQWLVYTTEPFYTIQLYVSVIIVNTSITDGVWEDLLCYCWNWCVCYLIQFLRFQFLCKFNCLYDVFAAIFPNLCTDRCLLYALGHECYLENKKSNRTSNDTTDLNVGILFHASVISGG